MSVNVKTEEGLLMVAGKPYNGNYVTPQMFGAKGDGITDDTEAIKLALLNSNTVYIPDGIYMVQTITETTPYNIVVESNKSIILDCNAVIKAIPNSSQNYSVLSVRNADSVLISGGKIIGDKSLNSGEWGHGINVIESTNITIEKANISNCLGDGIYIGGNDTNLTQSHNVKVRNCEIYECRRNGISITAGVDVLITDCVIHDISGTNPQCGIDIEVNANNINKNITIDGIVSYNVTFWDLAIYNNAENIYVSNCNFGHGIQLYYGKNVKLSNVKTHMTNPTGLDSFACDNFIAINCEFGHFRTLEERPCKGIVKDCIIKYTMENYSFVRIEKDCDIKFYNCIIHALQSGQSSSAYGVLAVPGSKTQFSNCEIILYYKFRGGILINGDTSVENCKMIVKDFGDQRTNRFPRSLIFAGNYIECPIAGSNLVIGAEEYSDNVYFITNNIINIPATQWVVGLEKPANLVLSNNTIKYERSDDTNLVYGSPLSLVKNGNTFA